MRWLLIIVGSLVAIVAIIAVGGMMLPRNHVATRSLTVTAPPDRVWSLITDVASFADWRPDVKRVELLPVRDGLRAWKESGSNGDIAFETVESVPPTRLVTRIVGHQDFGGSWTWALVPVEGGTRVTITENGEVYNPIFRFLSRFVFGHTSTMDDYLEALEKKLG